MARRLGSAITGAGPRGGMRLALAVGATLALSGCMENGATLFKKTPGTEGSVQGGSTRIVERDVEAPEVFQASEAGLWDGRPSLGGVWVAHPDVQDPERALIRNSSNSKFVIGALFRPSVERPGPRFQVSSDAAEALGMLAGQPVNLNVTALRREETAQPDADIAPETAAEETQVAAAPVATGASPTNAATQAEAAIARAEADAAAPAGVADAADGVAAVEAADAPDAPQKKKFRWPWQKKEADAPEAMAESVADDPQLTAAPAVETQALAPVAAPQVSAPAPKPARPAASKLDKPFIQIGIFSIEENANNTAVAMRQQGIVPTVRKQSSQGKTFWRVIVGPATSTEERAQLLTKVKAAGFTDAYAVTN
ncbi:SPOR domain-containing protein [Pseudooceanicola sp. C21-150M6]|uniref:SPOR domain-containing protein n=1 Tax=Pseudooceanicola sp. C21-150M6 TaxID=3434355 RepID=UPI003D7F9509